MGDFNKEYIYNEQDEHGLFYNNAPFVVILKLNEKFSVGDSVQAPIAKLVLEEVFGALEESKITADISETENINLSDKVDVEAILELFDSFGVKDETYELLVSLYLNDKFNIIEEFKSFSELAIKEKVNLEEKQGIQVALDLVDKIGVKDLQHVYGFLKLYDSFLVSDRQPKTAVSDFIIGTTEDLDNAYEWLVPFGLKIDWSKSNMPSMPEAELTTVEIPSVDGSIVEDTVYKDRMFQIVAYTEQGLNKSEKQQIKAKIARILDTTKKKAKKLTIQNSNISFDVRYDGQATLTEGSSYVKASIPFRTSPYGYSTFEEEMLGNGVITNGGDMDICPVTTITGYCRKPYFEINGVSYFYDNIVEDGGKLVIDHAMKSAYVIDGSGNKSNAMKDLHTNEFTKISVGSSVWVYAEDSATARQMSHTWRNRVLW